MPLSNTQAVQPGWSVLYRDDAIALGRVAGAPQSRSASGVTGPWPALVFPRKQVWAAETDADEQLLDCTQVAFADANALGGVRGTGFVLDWLAFSPAFEAACVDAPRSGLRSESMPQAAMLTPHLSLLQRMLFAYCVQADDADPLVIHEQSGSLLAGCCELLDDRTADPDAKAASETAAAHASVAMARAFIAAHLDEKITLSRIAEEVGVSAFHFARIFQRAVGISIAVYTQRLRLLGALEHLDLTSYDLAARFGFADRAHFSRHFSQLFGVSFQEIRTHFCNGNWDAIRKILHAASDESS